MHDVNDNNSGVEVPSMHNVNDNNSGVEVPSMNNVKWGEGT